MARWRLIAGQYKVLVKNENLPAQVTPVLQALHSASPGIEAAQAAKRALEAMWPFNRRVMNKVEPGMAAG